MKQQTETVSAAASSNAFMAKQPGSTVGRAKQTAALFPQQSSMQRFFPSKAVCSAVFAANHFTALLQQQSSMANTQAHFHSSHCCSFKPWLKSAARIKFLWHLSLGFHFVFFAYFFGISFNSSEKNLCQPPFFLSEKRYFKCVSKYLSLNKRFPAW